MKSNSIKFGNNNKFLGILGASNTFKVYFFLSINLSPLRSVTKNILSGK